jgi:hypothetical protein
MARESYTSAFSVIRHRSIHLTCTEYLAATKKCHGKQYIVIEYVEYKQSKNT